MDRISSAAAGCSSASSAAEPSGEQPMGRVASVNNSNATPASVSKPGAGKLTGFFRKLFTPQSAPKTVETTIQENAARIKLETRKEKIRLVLKDSVADGLNVFNKLNEAIRLNIDFKEIFPLSVTSAVMDLYLYLGDNIYKRKEEIFNVIEGITAQLPKSSPCYPSDELLKLLSEYRADSSNQTLAFYFSDIYQHFHEDYCREIRSHFSQKEIAKPYDRWDAAVTRENRMLCVNIRNKILSVIQSASRSESDINALERLMEVLRIVHSSIELRPDKWKGINNHYLGRLINTVNLYFQFVMDKIGENDAELVVKLNKLDNVEREKMGCSFIFHLNEETLPEKRYEFLNKAGFSDDLIKCINELHQTVKDVLTIK